MEYFDILYKLAKKASDKDEVPVAALLVQNDKIIAKAYNTRKKSKSAIDHAEIKCIVKANKRLRRRVLDDCSLVVSLEPCEMCKNIIREARIKEVYYFLPRNTQKKQYYKTRFSKLSTSDERNVSFQKLLSDFFKKRR